jgi:hypothetical protein
MPFKWLVWSNAERAVKPLMSQSVGAGRLIFGDVPHNGGLALGHEDWPPNKPEMRPNNVIMYFILL